MNWITTNIRLPEDMYMELKMTAARERKSVAGVIREKLASGKKFKKKDDLLMKMEKFAKKIAKNHEGLNLTQAVIDARYEE